MRLIEDTEDSIARLPDRGVGVYYGTAHIGTGYESGVWSSGGFVVVVETHHHLGVAVVDRDGRDFDQNLARFWGRKRSGGEREIGDTILRGFPL
jgi:hypothetical protein